ncbi:MAG: adenosylcobinamide-phosphate synthase CbiB [Syntrophobacteraceae bacterium]
MIFLPWHLTAAYVLDLVAGDPHWMPHPVRWIGRAVKWAEGLLYDPAASPLLLRISGMVLWMLVVTLTVSGAMALIGASRHAGEIVADAVLIWIAYTALATRGLHGESARVARALGEGDIELARERLSWIVSRDTSELDEAGILRALVETVSENISDGIVAPLFYLAIFGPVGALAYKAVNTMDSMLGYTNDKYRYFGWFPARADDVVNWIPARISGLLLVGASACVGCDWRAAMRTMRRDARKMKSPNAGYPEAAAAGALGVELGGTNIYFGQPVEKPRLGEPLGPITFETYRRMILLMYLTSGLAFFMAFTIRLSKEILGGGI